ncbi:MAG: trigger factor [Eubacteriales bacterium]|nr:trigger factor [Eubacteriales bacterium]
MTHSVEKHEDNTLTITVEISPEEFSKALDKAFKKHRNEFQIDGFRKGKAPKNVIFSRYGEAMFYEEALEHSVPDAYREAVEKEAIEPYSQPRFEVKDCSSKAGATVEAKIAVKPEIEVKDYFGVKAYRPPVEISAERIENELKAKQKQLARMLTVEDEPVSDGDTVIIDYAGFVGDDQFPGGTAEQQELVIGSKTFIPGFEEQIIGAKKGSDIEVKVTFPEDYGHEDLAGKEAIFKVHLHEIKREELPEIDDEFIKDIDDECDTVEEYKEKIKKDLEAVDQDQADQFFENEILRQIVEGVAAEVPAFAIEDEVEKILEEENQKLSYYGLSLEKYLEIVGQTLADFRKDKAEIARRRLLSTLVVDQIAEQEKVELSEEDYESEFSRLAEEYQMEVAKLKLSFDNQDGREMLKPGIIRRKTMELLVEKAEPTDQKPDFLLEEEAAEEGAEEASEEA